jgi:hypothetical protein
MRQVANSSCLLPSTMESMETGDAERDLNDTQSGADVLLRTYEVLPQGLPHYILELPAKIWKPTHTKRQKKRKLERQSESTIVSVSVSGLSGP